MSKLTEKRRSSMAVIAMNVNAENNTAADNPNQINIQIANANAMSSAKFGGKKKKNKMMQELIKSVEEQNLRRRLTIVEKDLMAEIDKFNPTEENKVLKDKAAKAFGSSLIDSFMPSFGVKQPEKGTQREAVDNESLKISKTDDGRLSITEEVVPANKVGADKFWNLQQPDFDVN